MKKVILFLLTFLFLNFSIGFAAPLNNMDQGKMAIGIVGGGITNCYYLENKVSNKLTIGIQSIKGDTDFYGEIDVSNSSDAGNSAGGPRLIIGNRDLDNGSTTYVGAGVTVPLTDGLGGYVSLIAGSRLQELQLGATSQIADNVSLNLNIRSVRHNGTKNGFGVGLDCRI